MFEETEGPIELEPNPVMTVALVFTTALPLATYKFLANGVVTPAVAYVTDDGELNAPPAVPVMNVSDVGYTSPLKRLIANPTLNAVGFA